MCREMGKDEREGELYCLRLRRGSSSRTKAYHPLPIFTFHSGNWLKVISMCPYIRPTNSSERHTGTTGTPRVRYETSRFSIPHDELRTPRDAAGSR